MKRYDFLSKDISENKEKIIEHVMKKYKLDLNEEPLNIISVKKYATKKLDTYNWDEALNLDDSWLKVDKSDSDLMKYTLDELKKILKNPDSYYSDIQCMMHFAAVYLAGRPIQMTDKMKTLWDPVIKGNKIDKNSARYYYPFSKNIDGILYRSNNLRGCQEFHELMISDRYFGMFDNKSEIKEHRRYSFWRCHEIYTDLKHTPIENLLLMEYSLGIGYVNKLYGWLRDEKFMSYVQQKDMKYLLDDSCTISCFVLRSKIMECLWKYLECAKNQEEGVVQAGYIIGQIAEAIDEIYSDILELCWSEFCLNLSPKRADMMQLQVKTIWENYFSEEVAYCDALDNVDGEDWRGIKEVSDCFTVISDFPLSEKQLTLKGEIPFANIRDYMYFTAEDIYGNAQIFVVESYRNEIGIKITDMVKEKIKRLEYPSEKVEQYKLYYKLREECFKELQRKNDDKTHGKSIRIPSNVNQLKNDHVYVILQRNIMAALLREKI